MITLSQMAEFCVILPRGLVSDTPSDDVMLIKERYIVPKHKQSRMM